MFTSNEKFPLKSVDTPVVVPVKTTSAPGSGWLEPSTTVPVSVCPYIEDAAINNTPNKILVIFFILK